MLLCKWHNDSGAGFPRSDGRLPSPPGPTLRDANRDFQGLPIRGCANIRRSVLQRKPLARSVGDCRPPFVFRFFGQSRLFPAGSRCGCSFSSGSQPKFFFLAAFGSTFLCGQFSHSPQTALSFLSSFTGTFETLCSVVSRARLEALLSRIIFKRFSRSSLDSWDSLRAFYHVGR